MSGGGCGFAIHQFGCPHGPSNHSPFVDSPRVHIQSQPSLYGRHVSPVVHARRISTPDGAVSIGCQSSVAIDTSKYYPSRSARSCTFPRSTSVSSPLSRSEEHTSALQSLMRISYAVFCLKKNNTTTIPNS